MDLESLLTDGDLEKAKIRSRSSLQKDRLKGTGPKYLKIGRLVRYRPADVQAWLAAREAQSTSQAA